VAGQPLPWKVVFVAINVRRPRTAGLPHEFPSGPQQISQNFKHVLALLADRLKQAENLGDVQDVPIARTNLSVPSSAEVQTGLDGKSDVGHLHVEADITNLDKYTQAEADALLAGKSNTGHTHVEADITNLDKYTQAQVDSLLAGKSNTGHTHVEADITDLDKYTQAEVDVLIGRRALLGPSLQDTFSRLGIDPLGLTIGPRLTWDFPTEDVKFTDAGSVGGTVQAWIEVKVNGVVGYLRVNSTK